MIAMDSADSLLPAHQHVVRHLEFDVAFTNEAQAFEWQERLQEFMRDRGRDAIRAIFDEFSVVDQVIALDQLDVDLGDFGEGDDFAVWQDRLGSVLRDTLRHELARHHAGPTRLAAALPRQQADWQALIHYLTNGHLSWRNSNHGNSAIADLIAAVFKQDGAARLVGWRRTHAAPARVARRLVLHLTDAQCVRLLEILTPVNARDLNAAMQGNALGHAGKAGPEQWLKLLAALLRCDVHADALIQADAAIEALPALAFAMAQAASSSLNPRSPLAQARLWAQTWRKLINALQAEDSARLEVIWRDCLRLSRRRLRRALLDLGQHTEQRQRMARLFSHSMLLELLGLFVPNDAEFIASLIQQTEAAASEPPGAVAHTSRRGDIYVLADSTNNSAREASALRRQLWEFTLTHLLTDRGSVFNRRAYAAALLQSAALREGFDYIELLRSMMRVLHTNAVATGLRRQLLQLLAELTETARQDRAGIDARLAHDLDVVQSAEARQSYRQRFAAALLTGDAHALHTMLLYGDAATVKSAPTTTDAQWLASELRRLAQTPEWADSMRRLVATLSDDALGTLAECLAPGEGSFIAVTITVIAPVAVEEGPTDLTLQRARHTLWEFTLIYLTADRGSHFNHQSYIGSVLRHMAEATGMQYLDLVEALRQSFARIPQPGPLQRQMAACIEELREDVNLNPSTTVANESRTERAWRARIANALQHTDESCWQRIWTEWAPRTPQVLNEELRALAQQPQVLQRLVSSLPARWRVAMLQLLLPEQSDFVARVIASGEAAARANRANRAGGAASMMGTGLDGKKAHDVLWEFSLVFVLSRNSSSFNRCAYAAFLLRKLAARDGIEYAALLLRITELLQYLPSAKDVPGDIAQILLGLSHATHPSESARQLQTVHQQVTPVACPPDAQSLDAMTDTKTSEQHHIDNKPSYETLLQSLMSLLRVQYAIPDVDIAKIIIAWLDGDTSLLKVAAVSTAMPSALATQRPNHKQTPDSKRPSTTAISSSPPTMAQAVRQEIDVWLRVPGRAASFATALSAGQRALLLQGMRSADYRAVIELVARMAARYRLYFANAQTFEKGLAFDMQWLDTEQWRFIFKYFFEEGRLFSTHDFLHRLATHLAAQERMVSLAHIIAKTNVNINICAILLDDSTAPSAKASSTATSSASLNPKTQSQSRVSTGVADIDTPSEAITKTDDDVDPIYITNAGLVLLSHYLPPLFDKLGLIRENRLTDDAAVARAIAATHTLVAGATPLVEADLTLNKLLCGVSPDFLPDFSCNADVVFNTEEQTLIDGLLQAVIAHWRALGSTSVAGLRESFLQREGCLSRKDDDWRLLVETRSYDMLLDRLPWGFATIKYSWMPGAIRVDWR
jgi:hypothetical protein